MKVLIDVCKLPPYAFQRGVGVYALNLYRTLNKYRIGDNEYFLYKSNKQIHVKTDIVHFPYFDPFFLTLPLIKQRPTIITVHDLTPIKFPAYYPRGFKGELKWQIQKKLIQQVDAIITDSVVSKKDIVKIMNYPQEKIYSIYLAAGEEFKQLTGNWQLAIKEKYHLPDTFLLYVGDANWNKNISGLLKAFYDVKTTDSKLKIILIGSAFKNDNLLELQEIKKLIKKLNIEKEVKLLGFVPIEDLVAIYNLAALYIQPSFDEGFGLPILEAMNCGCPVLSSNQGSLPEVGGQAVEYFDPNKNNELSKKITYLLNNKNKLNSLRILGLKQAKNFSWSKTAAETKKVYEATLSKN